METIFYRIAVVSLLFFLMSNCKKYGIENTPPPQVIKITDEIEESKITLSMLAESIEYTRLETTQESYIGKISILRCNNKYIVVHDNLLNKILLFNWEGKYINKIGKSGKGPGEYSYVSSLDISSDNDIIIVHDMVGKLIFYNVNNDFVKEIKTDLKVKDFSIINDKLFITSLYPNTIKYEGFSCFKVDCSNGKIIQRYLKRHDLKSGTQPMMACFNEYYGFNDSIFFWEYRYDTIYGVSKDFNIKARWVIDLGKRRVANDAFSSKTNLFKRTEDNGLILLSYVETDKYFFWEVIDNLERKRYITDKSGIKTSLLKYDNVNYLIPNDIDGGPDFWPNRVINSRMVLGIINSSVLLEERKSSVIINPVLDSISRITNEFDNPILMLVTLKEL